MLHLFIQKTFALQTLQEFIYNSKKPQEREHSSIQLRPPPPQTQRTHTEDRRLMSPTTKSADVTRLESLCQSGPITGELGLRLCCLHISIALRSQPMTYARGEITNEQQTCCGRALQLRQLILSSRICEQR